MPWYPADAPVPPGLRTDEFLLRPLRATDVELDYDAVIGSRDLLLVYSGGRWPAEEFSLADNLADLEEHEREHEERLAFTYTLMNPNETRCLGCVYINPLRPMLRRLSGRRDEAADDPAWRDARDDEAVVSFWVRPEGVVADLDRRLLATLLDWLDREWTFPRVAFLVNANQHRELRLFEDAGLRRRYTVERQQGPHAVLFHSRNAAPGVSS